jgi:hypothetical protein
MAAPTGGTNSRIAALQTPYNGIALFRVSGFSRDFFRELESRLFAWVTKYYCISVTQFRAGVANLFRNVELSGYP